MKKHIVLIGFMGAGKTTLGKKIASKLNMPFIDTDAIIEKQENKTISEIFRDNGEEYFRELEHDFILKFSDIEPSIISTGGGMPCYKNNMVLLKKTGCVIYLQHPPGQLANRLYHAKKSRPLIEGKTLDAIQSLIHFKLNERELYYKQADYILAPDSQTIDRILSLINNDYPCQFVTK